MEEAPLGRSYRRWMGAARTGEELRSSLEEFDELWEELFPAERARMIGLLAEGVEYEGREGTVTLKFRANKVEASTT